MTAARAPGKIILSGEHAVVYGRPALVLAVDRYATIRVAADPALQVVLGDGLEATLPPEQAPAFKRRIDAAHAAFESGTGALSEVIRTPPELVLYTVAAFFEAAGLKAEGLRVDLESEIPLGCGMGSSAAVILAILYALAARFGVPWDKQRFYELALQSENLQHGRSSGVDPYTCLHGGFQKFRDGEAEALEVSGFSFQLVLTGRPACSTGACVSAVREGFEHSAIWEQFEAVERYIEDGLRNDDAQTLLHGIRKNHELLCTIGVVPDRVADFVQEIHRQGGAAKICGAGAIEGDAAGMVLIYGLEDLGGLPERFGYTPFQVEVDHHGTRIL